MPYDEEAERLALATKSWVKPVGSIKLDISPDRPVSSKNENLTLRHVIEIAARGQGFQVKWADKDHRLLRTCKTLVRHRYLRCSRSAFGSSIFHLTPEWPGFSGDKK